MHRVSVPVIAPVPFECKFWQDSDVWHAVADRLNITVQGTSFEDAKRNMETALNDYVQSLVRKPAATSRKIAV
jgi:predicted RNase H-like HicB family nuclease